MTGIAIDEVTTSADRPEYQARMVANAANEPGWFKYLNAYKFRQDRGGHCTKVSTSSPPTVRRGLVRGSGFPLDELKKSKILKLKFSAWPSFG